MVIMAFFRLAGAPHKINTIGFSRSLRMEIILSVKISQPLPWWELALWACTVKTVFSNNTPCLAHGSRQPLSGTLQPKSVSSSLKIFCKEGGRWHIWQYRKTQTMGLPRLMIWVLAKDNHLGIRQAGIVQGIEYGIHIRKDLPGTIFIYKKLAKLFIIWLLHFRKQILLPIICKNSHSHHLTRSIPQQRKIEKGTTKAVPFF